MHPETIILYIEDNPENLQLVKRILQAEGVIVLEAFDTAGAMDILGRQKPDLILMDINMPGIDGLTLTTRLKALPALEGVPVVALTANAMKGDRERSLQAGCDGYITKPVDVDKLPQQVQAFLPIQR